MEEETAPHSGEPLLRRFCPTNRDHVVVDEKSDEIRIRSGAVGVRKGENGISIYRREVLHENDLGDCAIAHGAYDGIACSNAETIRASTKMRSVADAWPYGLKNYPSIDAAHALILVDGLRGGELRRTLTILARLFDITCLPDEEACRLAVDGASKQA